MSTQEKLNNLISKLVESIDKAIDLNQIELAKDLSLILDKLIA